MAYKIRRTAKGIIIAQTTSDKIGFYGVTPVIQQASAAQAIATDPTSVITLANALRAALVANGLIKGAA